MFEKNDHIPTYKTLTGDLKKQAKSYDKDPIVRKLRKLRHPKGTSGFIIKPKGKNEFERQFLYSNPPEVRQSVPWGTGHRGLKRINRLKKHTPNAQQLEKAPYVYPKRHAERIVIMKNMVHDGTKFVKAQDYYGPEYKSSYAAGGFGSSLVLAPQKNTSNSKAPATSPYVTTKWDVSNGIQSRPLKSKQKFIPRLFVDLDRIWPSYAGGFYSISGQNLYGPIYVSENVKQDAIIQQKRDINGNYYWGLDVKHPTNGVEYDYQLFSKVEGFTWPATAFSATMYKIGITNTIRLVNQMPWLVKEEDSQHPKTVELYDYVALSAERVQFLHPAPSGVAWTSIAGASQIDISDPSLLMDADQFGVRPMVYATANFGNIYEANPMDLTVWHVVSESPSTSWKKIISNTDATYSVATDGNILFGNRWPWSDYNIKPFWYTVGPTGTADIVDLKNIQTLSTQTNIDIGAYCGGIKDIAFNDYADYFVLGNNSKIIQSRENEYWGIPNQSNYWFDWTPYFEENSNYFSYYTPVSSTFKSLLPLQVAEHIPGFENPVVLTTELVSGISLPGKPNVRVATLLIPEYFNYNYVGGIPAPSPSGINTFGWYPWPLIVDSASSYASGIEDFNNEITDIIIGKHSALQLGDLYPVYISTKDKSSTEPGGVYFGFTGDTQHEINVIHRIAKGNIQSMKIEKGFHTKPTDTRIVVTANPGSAFDSISAGIYQFTTNVDAFSESNIIYKDFRPIYLPPHGSNPIHPLSSVKTGNAHFVTGKNEIIVPIEAYDSQPIGGVLIQDRSYIYDAYVSNLSAHSVPSEFPVPYNLKNGSSYLLKHEKSGGFPVFKVNPNRDWNFTPYLNGPFARTRSAIYKECPVTIAPVLSTVYYEDDTTGTWCTGGNLSKGPPPKLFTFMDNFGLVSNINSTSGVSLPFDGLFEVKVYKGVTTNINTPNNIPRTYRMRNNLFVEYMPIDIANTVRIPFVNLGVIKYPETKVGELKIENSLNTEIIILGVHKGRDFTNSNARLQPISIPTIVNAGDTLSINVSSYNWSNINYTSEQTKETVFFTVSTQHFGEVNLMTTIYYEYKGATRPTSRLSQVSFTSEEQLTLAKQRDKRLRNLGYF